MEKYCTTGQVTYNFMVYAHCMHIHLRVHTHSEYVIRALMLRYPILSLSFYILCIVEINKQVW